MWLREHGRVFDWGTLRWCQMYASPPNGCYDAETIALDEFGHIQGLDHHVNHSDDRDYLDAVVQTFSRTQPSSGWNMHVYGRCDVATLQLRYDVASWTTPYSTCLDLDDHADPQREPDVDRLWRHDAPDRGAQGRRCRRLLPAQGQPDQ